MRGPDGKLTREQQIKLGLHLLNVSPQDRTKWQWRLECALDDIQEADIAAAFAKSERAGLIKERRNSYYRAARRLQVTDRALRNAIEQYGVYSSDMDGLPTPDAITRAVTFSTPKPGRKKIKIEPGNPLNPFAAYAAEASTPWEREKTAIALADALLKQRGAKRLIARHGDWHKLATILFGNLKINLYRHLHRYAQEQNKSQRI